MDTEVHPDQQSLTLRKQITFDGLRVELFEALNDPIAAAENEMLQSQMLEAQQQKFADGNPDEPFEVLQHASRDSDTSSIAADDNRYGCWNLGLMGV